MVAAKQKSRERSPDPLTEVHLPFFGPSTFRSTSADKDQRFVNCYFDPQVNPISKDIDYFCVKRPGTAIYNQPTGTTGTARGVYYWSTTDKVYSVIGNKIYSGSTDLGVTLTGATGRCCFAETRPGATTKYLGINDGVKLYLIATNDAVTTVTTNFPTPNTGDLVYFDTYFMVLDSTGKMWNCDTDDPTSWNVTKNINAQMVGGSGTALAQTANYVVLFTDRSCQFFWDQANTSGSPYGNVEQGMKNIGCAAKASVAFSEDRTYWIGNGRNGGPTVWKMDSSSADDIGTSAISRIMEQEGSSLASAVGNAFRIAGHYFYVLTLASASRTFVYVDNAKSWVEWTNTAGTAKFPFSYFTQYLGKVLALHDTDGWIYTLDPAVTQDNSVSFPVLMRFGRWDGGSNKRKFCSMVEIVGDNPVNTCNVSLQYSDDDYQTLSTARTIDMAAPHPFATRFGNFKRRAWQISYTGAEALRLHKLIMYVYAGSL